MILAWLLIKLIAPSVHIKRGHNGSEFEFSTDTIYYDPNPDPFDKCFLRHTREKHFFNTAGHYSFRLWSILHELGHYFYPDEDEDEFGKAICALCPSEDALTNVAIQDMYYDSPDEYAATEWAIDWIVSHPKLASLFSALL